MARFSKDKWPDDGPVRALLSYLDTLHRQAGQPSLTEMGRAVALAPSTLSAFFTGTRLINKGNLELVVEHLGGDVERAERLRRKAATAWQDDRPVKKGGPVRRVEEHDDRSWRAESSDDQAARLEIVLFDAPVNKLNRPEELLGREVLSDSLQPLLDQGQRVLLYGLGGTGKTALAATIADERVEAGKGPYLWLRSGLADPDVILDALIRQLAEPRHRERLRDAVGDARTVALREMIEQSGIRLCVIDDAWHPAALHALTRAIPDHIPVLVTSRLKLGLDQSVEVSGLGALDALSLLALHAKSDDVADSAEAAELCADLGFHPYAIEIAGQHLRQYAASPAELRQQIADAPHDLPMPGGFAPVGRESVKRLLDRTCEALSSSDAQLVLRAFGAFFSAGLTVELLTAYLKIEERRVRAALNVLVDLSLVKRQAGTTHYVMHDLTFSYARELHGASPVARQTVVEASRAFVHDHIAEFDLLGLELSNLLGVASMARSIDIDAFNEIIDGLALGGYLDAKGHTLGFLRMLDEAIELATDQPERLHHLLTKRGNALANQGEWAAAAEAYEGALQLAPNAGREVVILGLIGKMLVELGLHDEADQHFNRAYAICDSTQDEQGTIRVLEMHSYAAFRQEKYPLACELMAKGVDVARKIGDKTREAFLLNNLGTAEFRLGVTKAIERHESARVLAKELGDDHILALSHRTLGADYHALEDFQTAQRHFNEALRLYTALGKSDKRSKLEQSIDKFGYLT